jgi:hypothetical protein
MDHMKGEEKLPSSAASEYLRERGILVEPATLKQWRTRNKGPAYYVDFSGRVYYRPVDLDAFSTSAVQRIEPGA